MEPENYALEDDGPCQVAGWLFSSFSRVFYDWDAGMHKVLKKDAGRPRPTKMTWHVLSLLGDPNLNPSYLIMAS